MAECPIELLQGLARLKIEKLEPARLGQVGVREPRTNL
jgi:hypothetical protein